MHRTAAKVAERLALRGLSVEIRELPDSTRTAKEAATACGCDVARSWSRSSLVVDNVPLIVLCAGDRRVEQLDGRPASADGNPRRTELRRRRPAARTRLDLPPTVDESLSRLDSVWSAAGTAHAVFEARLTERVAALPDPEIRAV
jgi:prolyl-tRNA editing enzyme YbaK/EbsC (Cys-tRNA(Pro) deacylase)